MVQGGLTLRGETDSGSKEQVKICRSKSKGTFPSGWSQTHEPTSIEFNILWNSSITNIISCIFILFDPNLPTLRLYISSISVLLSHFYFVLLIPLLSHFLFSSSCSPFFFSRLGYHWNHSLPILSVPLGFNSSFIQHNLPLWIDRIVINNTGADEQGMFTSKAVW